MRRRNLKERQIARVIELRAKLKNLALEERPIDDLAELFALYKMLIREHVDLQQAG